MPPDDRELPLSCSILLGSHLPSCSEKRQFSLTVLPWTLILDVGAPRPFSLTFTHFWIPSYHAHVHVLLFKEHLIICPL